MSDKLKSCPFFCQECKIGTDYYETADEARQAWNRRAGEQE